MPYACLYAICMPVYTYMHVYIYSVSACCLYIYVYVYICLTWHGIILFFRMGVEQTSREKVAWEKGEISSHNGREERGMGMHVSRREKRGQWQ